MPFNYPWDGTQPPFANGYMVLTHDESMYVKTETERIIAEFVPANPWDPATPTEAYVLDAYNNLDSWQKAINGENYALIKQYDPTVNTLGIDSTGIVIPNEAPIDEETSGDIEQPLEEE